MIQCQWRQKSIKEMKRVGKVMLLDLKIIDFKIFSDLALLMCMPPTAF